MGFDVSKNNLSVNAEAGHEFELEFPGSTEPTGAFIKVRGSESKIVKAYNRKKFNEFQQRATLARKRGKDPEEMSLDDAEDLAVEGAIVRIISWSGILEDGKEVAFTPENADRILREHSWIRDQVQEESGQLLNFRSA